MASSTALETAASPERQTYARWFLTAVLCVLAVLAIGAVLYRASFLIELNINEGWNAYHVQSLLHGQPLYPARDSLVTNNYPPLAFLPVAAVAFFTHDPLFAGRLLSIAALAILCVCVYGVARKLNAGRWPAFVAMVAYAATMSRLFDSQVGVNDPQLLGNMLSALGLLAFLHARAKGDRWCVLPALLFVCACFVKPFTLALPAGAFLVLALDDWRAAARFALVGVAAGLVGLGLSRLAFGPNFLPDILGARPYSLARGLKALEDLHKLGVQLAAWLACLATTKDGPRRRLINSLCILAALESFVFRGAAEVHYNVAFDLVFSLHLALAVALDQFVRHPLRVGWPAFGAAEVGWPAFGAAEIVMLGLVLRLPFGGHHDAFQAIYDPAWRQGLQRAEAATQADVAQVAALQGPVFCQRTLICYLAGKPFVVDPVNVELRMAGGALPPDTLTRLYASHRLTLAPPDPVATFAEP
jgi:hypothetical protein